MTKHGPVLQAEEKGRPYRIELRLGDMNQLFNTMDPSPFHEKDLDHDAEEFIESWAYEYPAGAPLSLRVHLEQWPPEDPSGIIRQAVHNYFSYRAKINSLEFKRLMRLGRASLLTGLAFLTLCLLAGRLLFSGDTPGAALVRESLTIIGWVAMWRPLEIYLYDWWPVRRWGRIYSKLSSMPVEVVQDRFPGKPGEPAGRV